MRLPALRAFALLSSLSVLAGCSASFSKSLPSATTSTTYSGRVHGGEQPVKGSTIQLYTVGTTGDGSAATPLLASTVTTDSNGYFSITGLYNCSAATDVFLLATGGNPGLSSPNPNLTLLAALGPCGALTPQTFISVNELTTVAAVYALAPFMTAATQIGSAPNDAAALDVAFALANGIVNTATGAIQPNASIPAAQLNTLADIIAACVNSTGGAAGDTTLCGKLFTFATPSGFPPTDTVDALLNIAHDPTRNVAQLFSLTPAAAPFQPSVAIAPLDFALQQTPSANVASGLQIAPATLSFPATPSGGPGSTETIALSNPGSTAVTLNSLAFTGPNAADFSQTNTCGTSLAAGANCFANVQFLPQTTGAETATLALASSAPDSPQAVILTGTGAPAPNGPHAVLSSTVVQPYPGASYDITLANTGNAPLTVSSIALENTPFNTQSNNCPSTLVPAASCIITIHSIARGADQLTILTNDPNFIPGILVFQPSVYLGPGEIYYVLSPSDIFFPDGTLGSPQSFSYTYTLSGIPSPTLSGPQASDFSLSTPACAIADQGLDTIPTCTVIVTFTPSAAGLRTARLAFDSSANYIPLAGTGISGPPASGLTLSASSLSFDFNPTPQTLTLTNPGASAVSIAGVSIQSLTGASEYAQTNTCGASLAPNANCAIVVTSSRLTEGATQAMLTIATGATTFDVPLSNTLYPVLNFGPTAIGSPSLATQYPVANAFFSNVGNTTLDGVVAGASASHFSFTSCTSSTTSCIDVASFTPALAGLQSATLTTTNTYPGLTPSLRYYSLLGTGATAAPVTNLALSQSGFSIVSGQPTTETLTMNTLGPATVSLSTPTLSGGNLGNTSLSFTYPTCYGPPTGDAMVYAQFGPATQCTATVTGNAPTGFLTTTASVTDSISGLSFSLPMYFDSVAGPTVSPSSLTFPHTTDNTFSPPQSVTVTRPPGHPVNVTVSSNIVPLKGTCTATEVPCILTFVFAPTASNPAYAEIVVNDAEWQAPTSVGVQGFGVPPAIPSSASVNPTSLTFPLTAVATSSRSLSIAVSNGGPGSLLFLGLSFTGPNASEFSQMGGCAFTLPANATCHINVTFSPVSAGPKSAILTIDGGPTTGLPVSVNLSGTAQ